MYSLKPGIKQNPERRWALPDRIFFGHGACHILAGVYLRDVGIPGFFAERIIPANGLPGNHIFISDGNIAFDYHGYSGRGRLLLHHRKIWSLRHDLWDFRIEKVEFDLLNTSELNDRKMLGPDQYFGDPIDRARQYLSRIDHSKAISRCRNLLVLARSHGSSNPVSPACSLKQ